MGAPQGTPLRVDSPTLVIHLHYGQAQLFETGAYSFGVARYYDVEVAHVQKIGSRPADVFERGLRERLRELSEVVIRKIEGYYAAQLADYLELSLELAWNAAEDAVYGVSEFGWGYGFVADYALELLQGFDDGLSLVTAVWTPPPATRMEGPRLQSMLDMYP